MDIIIVFVAIGIFVIGMLGYTIIKESKKDKENK